MSILYIGQLFKVTRANSIFQAICLTTLAKVSIYSRLYSCLNPLATNRALNTTSLIRVKLVEFLSLYTQRVLIGLTTLDLDTNYQILLAYKVSSSVYIALNHWSLYIELIASL